MPGARRPEQACVVPASRQCVRRRAAGTAQACSGLHFPISRAANSVQNPLILVRLWFPFAAPLMLFILLHIVFSSFFVLCVRWTQRRKEDVITVGAINYLVAAAGAFAIFAVQETTSVTFNAVLTGSVGGVFYFVAFFFLIVAASWKGAANTTVVSRLSILVPILAGAFIWNEWPGFWQQVAIGLACLSLLLIARKGNQIAGAKPPRYAGLMLCAFFLCGGGCRLAPEMFKNLCEPAEKTVFLSILFGITACASLIVLSVRRHRPNMTEILAGVAMGAANLAQSFCIIYALRQYDGFIVFPMSAAGSLIFTTAVAVLILKERLNRASFAGVAIATGALLMLKPATF